MNKEIKNNENRLKAAGLRMALKMVPQELIDQAPAKVEGYLKGLLEEVELERHEAGACFLVAPDRNTGALRIMIVTLDEQNAVSHIAKETTTAEIFDLILKNLKEL